MMSSRRHYPNVLSANVGHSVVATLTLHIYGVITVRIRKEHGIQCMQHSFGTIREKLTEMCDFLKHIKRIFTFFR